MAIRFVLGAPGTGKTTYVIHEMLKRKVDLPASNKVNQLSPCYYIVPEQYTLKAQEKILKQANGLLDIEVLSFNRLVFRYIDYLGLAAQKTINDSGKSMLIRQIIEEHKNEFVWINKHRKKQSYMDELNSLMTECYQYNLTDAHLEESIQKTEKQLLKDKLKDIKTLFYYFRQAIEETFITPQEGSLAFVRKIKEIEPLKQVSLFFDGFYGFTPLQYVLIEGLMTICKELTFIITIPANEKLGDMRYETELFYESKKAIAKLRQLAEGLGVTEEDEIQLDSIKREQKPDIQHLVNHLYRYPISVYEGECNGIRIVEAMDIKSEVQVVASRIHSLIKTKNFRYHDITVISSELDAYEAYIIEALQEYEIPYFIDKKNTIARHPLVLFILSAIDIVQFDFKYESIFSHLKTVYYENNDLIQRLETYSIKHGIKGVRRLKRLLVSEEDWIVECNLLLTPLLQFYDGMKKANNVEEKTKILYEYLQNIKVFEKHKDLAEIYIKKEELSEGLKYIKVYELSIELLDELVTLVGNQVVTVSEYGSMLETGLSGIKFGMTPASVDQILVGDLRRTRFNETKVLFVLGINEGKVPYVQSGKQLLTDLERSFLLGIGLEFAPTKQKSLFKEQMNIYMTLVKARQLLHLSYTRLDQEKTTRPATIFIMLRKMFPTLMLTNSNQILKENEKISKIKPTFSQFITLTWQNNCAIQEKQFQTMYFFLLKAYNNKVALSLNPDVIIKGIQYDNTTPILTKAPHQEVAISVSKLESYAGCPYQHFLTYNLKVSNLEEYVITLPDIGNLFHMCLENYMKRCIKYQIDISSIDSEKRNKFVEEAVEDVLSDIHIGVFLSSYRYKYLAVKLTRILKRALWGIENQLKSGLFRPKENEYKFDGKQFPLESLTVELSNGEKLYLKGIVDRVDEYETDQALYISIIDYKSGDKDIDLNLTEAGTGLQLILYLKVVKELKGNNSGKVIIPAGMYYYQIQDPLISIEEKELIEDSLLTKLRPKGLILHDETVIKLFDQTINGTSKVIPASLGKTGISSRSSTITKDNLETVFAYVDYKIKDISQQMVDGHIGINPIFYEGKSPCDYCKYKSICRFDPSESKESYRMIYKKKDEDVIEEFKKYTSS